MSRHVVHNSSFPSSKLDDFYSEATMIRRAFGSLQYDDPPAPQEPPQYHTPLSPPRQRKIFGHRPSTASGVMTSSMRNSAPIHSSPSRPQTPKVRTRSADETQRASEGLRRATSANFPVTKDKTELMSSNAFAPLDKCPPTKTGVGAKNIISVTVSALAAGQVDSKAHVSLFKKESPSAPPACGVQGKRAPIKANSTSYKTTTMPSLKGSPRIPGHPYANTTQAAAGTETYFAMRRDSVDTDGRSLISSFLDAYCRSEMGDGEAEFRWPDDASMLLSEDTTSLEYASDAASSRFRDRPDSDATAVSTNDIPKRPKPASLVLTSTGDWEGASKAFDLPTTPQTAPAAARNTRPLPPLPPIQRQIRPLPRPPVPPPYTSPVDPIPLLNISPRTSSSSTTSSPSSSGSTSITSVATSSPRSSTELDLDKLSDKPNISKRPLLAPILTITANSSCSPSPLSPDMPLPPSPMTAKRHQASKLSKMLGEEITPDLLDTRPTISRRPPPRSHPSNVTQCAMGKKVDVRFGVLPSARSAPAPAPTFRDAEILKASLRSRAGRPQAIYLHDDTSEETHQHGDSAGYVEEEGSMTEASFSETSANITASAIPVDLAVEEGLDDKSSLSSGDGGKADSEEDSILEELDDLEEAHIGWALQNVVTYQEASRVKRATRAWVLEKNGQRWEEQNYSNVLKALRQL